MLSWFFQEEKKKSLLWKTAWWGFLAIDHRSTFTIKRYKKIKTKSRISHCNGIMNSVSAIKTNLFHQKVKFQNFQHFYQTDVIQFRLWTTLTLSRLGVFLGKVWHSADPQTTNAATFVCKAWTGLLQRKGHLTAMLQNVKWNIKKKKTQTRKLKRKQEELTIKGKCVEQDSPLTNVSKK